MIGTYLLAWAAGITVILFLAAAGVVLLAIDSYLHRHRSRPVEFYPATVRIGALVDVYDQAADEVLS